MSYKQKSEQAVYDAAWGFALESRAIKEFDKSARALGLSRTATDRAYHAFFDKGRKKK